MTDGSQHQANVFLSYSRKDVDAVRRLVTALEERGVDAWVDWEDIPPSADWWREICAAIESADAFVFVMSPDALDSGVCTEELQHAIRHNKRLVPVVCRELAAATAILEPMRRINWVMLRSGDAFEAGVSMIMEAVDTDLDWVRAHTHLLERAAQWEVRGRDASFLLQKNGLAEAEQWLARGPDKEPRPTALQTEYIIAGRTAATRQQRRLTTYAVAAGFLIAVGAVAALVGFTRAERSAREALSRQLAAESKLSLGADTHGALARAVLALRTVPTLEAQSAVLAASDYASGASRLLAGHDGVVGRLAFSPDGRLLATAANDTTIMLWETSSGIPVRQLAGHGGEVADIAFSPDGQRLASASTDAAVIIWDVGTGKVLHKLEGRDGQVVNLAISPDGTRLASAGEKSLSLWDMTSGRRHYQMPVRNVFFVAFSPDGRRIATDDGDGAVALWDTDTGERLHRLTGHAEGFLTMVSGAFLDGGRRLVTVATTDNNALVWEVKTGRLLTRLRGHERGVEVVSVSPDGRWIATGGPDNVNIWDAGSGKLARRLEGTVTTELTFYSVLAFTPDSRRLLTRTAADTVVLWDLERGFALRRFRGHGTELLTGALSPDGRWLATGGSDGTSILWDLTNPGPSWRIQANQGAFSPNGRWLAITSGNRATILDMATGARVRDLVHGAPVLTIAFSADGKRVATGGGDKAALVWDADSGTLLHRLAGHDHGVSRLTFAADGSTLTTGTSTGDRAVWDLQVRPERPSPLRRYSEPDRPTEGTDVFDIAYTADGTRYATTVLDRIPVIWDRATNTELHRLRGHREDVQCVRFSLDGRLLATGGRDDVAIVWDAASGTLLRRLVGHAGTIDDLAFSPDADRIATVSDDGTVILWDVSTGAALHRFERPTYSVRDVVFSPDGKRLLISGSARAISLAHRIIPETIETLVVYDIDLASLVARSCDILDPGVSAEAWARRVPGRPYPLSCQDLEELTNARREG